MQKKITFHYLENMKYKDKLKKVLIANIISHLHPYINENIECAFCSLKMAEIKEPNDEDTLFMWKNKILHENCIYKSEEM